MRISYITKRFTMFDRKRQMYSTITFSADIIMIGDAYLSNQW